MRYWWPTSWVTMWWYWSPLRLLHVTRDPKSKSHLIREYKVLKYTQNPFLWFWLTGTSNYRLSLQWILPGCQAAAQIHFWFQIHVANRKFTALYQDGIPRLPNNIRFHRGSSYPSGDPSSAVSRNILRARSSSLHAPAAGYSIQPRNQITLSSQDTFLIMTDKWSVIRNHSPTDCVQWENANAQISREKVIAKGPEILSCTSDPISADSPELQVILWNRTKRLQVQIQKILTFLINRNCLKPNRHTYLLPNSATFF